MIEESPVIRKTRELCQTILDQPNMQSIRQRIDAFMGDEKTRAQYDGLAVKGQALQQKQQLSLPLTGEEVSDFEQHREALLTNPVASGFLAPRNVTGLAPIRTPAGKAVLVASYGDSLQAFTIVER